MHILITGGSGFLGKALTAKLMATHQVTWVSRHTNTSTPNGVTLIDYATLASTTQHFDIIINLAGAGIADKRWTHKRKQYLLDSRLTPTQAVLNYIKRVSEQALIKPSLFISSSAIGWYGSQIAPPPDKGEVGRGLSDSNSLQASSNKNELTTLTESSPKVTHDFAHQLCNKWEKLALTANQFDVPVAIIRTGVVLSGTGGMIDKLKLPFSLGLGGNLGNGKQIMSWISLTDWVNAVLFIIEHIVIKQNQANNTPPLASQQIYNLTAPNAVSNSEFTKAVGSWLNRPTVFHQPEFLVKRLFGEMATLLIDGQNVYPHNLLQAGFEFEHLTVSKALSES